MESDWLTASLELVTALYPAKAQGEVNALYAQLAVLVCRYAQAQGVMLVQWEDRFTVRCLTTAPETFSGDRIDADWLAGIIDGDGIRIAAPLPDRAAQVTLPVVQGEFRGALLLWCPAASAADTAFLNFLERTRQETREVVRLGQLAALLDDWRTRSTAILEAIPQGVVFIDNSGRRAWVNAPGAALLHIPPAAQEPLVIATAMQQLRTAAVNATEIAATGSRLFSAPDQRIQDWHWVFGDPLERVLSVVSVPLTSARVTGRLWVFDDVTPQQRAAQALQGLNVELARQRAEAEAHSRAKSEFLANMSHEIRTPMNGVLGLAQILQRELVSDSHRELVTQIRRAGESLLMILNDILDFSKIEAGQLRIEQHPFDLRVVLAQLDSLLGETAHGKGIRLWIEAPPPAVVALSGDAHRLEQVLLNLIGNAIKFTERGTVRVRVQPMAATETTVRLRFEVQDSGIGIAAADLTRLFAPFVQAEQGTTRRFGGTGLGLSICKRLMELMGGTIGAESTVAEGSCFWFELPLALAPAGTLDAEPQPPVAARGPRLDGAHFLVVDDSAMNRDLVARALALEGATASLAGDGRQAITTLKAQPGAFAAVLMDVRMPVMDGLAATHLIRHDLGMRELPVIALTAGVLAEELEAALAAGMSEVLPKPLDLEQVTTCLLRWVTSRRPSDAPAVAPPTLSTTAVSPLAIPAAGERFPEIAGIDRARAEQSLSHRPDLFIRLLAAFADEFAAAVELTRGDLAAGERGAAVRRLHTLRGNAGTLGARHLMQTAGALETAIKQGEADLDERMQTLSDQLAALIQASAPWRAGAAPAMASGDTTAAGSVLTPVQFEELCEALRTRDLDALSCFEALEPALHRTLDGHTTGAVGRAIRGLRFDEALAILEQAANDICAPDRLRRFPSHSFPVESS